MATANPFDLLGDDDNDDPTHLIAVHKQKIAAKKTEPVAAPQAPARLPTKPVPPAQAVREARGNAVPSRGGGRSGQGRGRGGRGGGSGPNRDRDLGNGNVDGFAGSFGGGGAAQDGETGKPLDRERGSYGGSRQLYGGIRRGGIGNGEAGGDFERPPRRVFERRSGTGRGMEVKREGYGRGNWGNLIDHVNAQVPEEVANVEEKIPSPEKQLDQEIPPTSETNKDSKEAEGEKEQEDKEMTLEEYEKIREEKRKALLSLKAQERKVDVDKEFQSMQQLSIKKGNDEVFIKLGSDKDSKKQKDHTDRDEKAKKPLSINEFLKPAEGEKYYSPGGRGRGRGRGDRGTSRGGYGRGGDSLNSAVAIKIEDPGQFPTLGGK